MAVMRNAPFLRVLSEDALKLLAFASEPVDLRPRQSLFEAGDPAEGAVLVLGGQLRLFGSAKGAPPRVAGVGQLVDEIALIIPTQRSASAVAQTTCELLLLPRGQMLKILEEYPDAAQKLQGVLARRATAFMEDVAAISKRLNDPSAS
ncbi:Crp/Fnr family transcriptional regulator [Acuticoccus kandeliae]|uniref:Crp/Fnr family transcriptional regulator n=1 Tax=Acuticoccus kandeliae TaxID=2073160 RepID=UPI000D3E43C3|nr:cyclic nucleotide-binding domain-containing protein [Acuticoccus kandeliae]